MKLNSFKLLLILTICGCSLTNKQKIQKTWIGKYHVHHFGTEQESIDHWGNRIILKFEDKELIIKNFHSDFLSDNNKQVSESYQFQKDQILLQDDTLLVQNIYEDSLVFFSNRDYPRKTVYEELKRFNQANRLEEFFQLITSNTFLIQKNSVQIEFRNNGKYVSDNFRVGAGSNQFWMIDKFENELFLVLDEYWGAVFHIEDFDSERIVSKIYRKENEEVIFNKVSNDTGYDISKIVGEWKEEEKSIPPPPPVESLKKFYNEELLIISESEVVKCKGFRRDTFKWEFNRGKNIMILKGNKDRIYPKQWNILSIEDETLTLERQRVLRNTFGERVETMKFKRTK